MMEKRILDATCGGRREDERMNEEIKKIDDYLRRNYIPALFRVDGDWLVHHTMYIDDYELKTIKTKLLDLRDGWNVVAISDAIHGGYISEFLYKFGEKITKEVLKRKSEMKE